MANFHEYTPEDLLGPWNEVERKNAPSRLFVAGHPDVLRFGARVSIVGSRRASPAGLSEADALATALVAHGVVIVSGLAEGIDTSAHRAAIGGSGRTIAVLGTPLDQAYPAKNRELQALIMRDHLCLSQFAPGTPSQRGNFPMRNRTMALISDATIIVEAGEGSGSLHQGWEALRLGRPLFLLDRVFADPGLAWPTEMAHYGAQRISQDALELILEFLPERSGEADSAFAL